MSEATSSIPGGVATSSATTSSSPWAAKTRTAYSCSRCQCCSSSCSAETSCAHRLSSSCWAWAPSSASKESPSEWAGSVERTIVRSPCRAHRSAVAAATDVLPTPPLPVKRMTLTMPSLRDHYPTEPRSAPLPDQQRDGLGADEQQRDHRRRHDQEPDEVRREVRDLVQRDRRVGVWDHDRAPRRASPSLPDGPVRLLRAQGHLDALLPGAAGGRLLRTRRPRLGRSRRLRWSGRRLRGPAGCRRAALVPSRHRTARVYRTRAGDQGEQAGDTRSCASTLT